MEQQALMADKLQCINNPLYPACIKYAEPDVQWQACMPTAAPDPEAFFKQAGYAHVHQCCKRFSNTADTLTRTVKTASIMKWVTQGFELSFVSV